MSSATRKCRKREDKRQALAFSKTPEARKERIKLADNAQWLKRQGHPLGFHNPKHMDRSVYTGKQSGIGGKPVAMRLVGSRASTPREA